MFSDAEKAAIQRSWRLVVPIAEAAADLFYKRLFELRPEYKSLFPAEMSGQKRKLVRMLAFIVKALDWKDEAWRDDVNPNEDLFLVMLALGRRHSDLYKIPTESYAPVGEALLWTLDYGLGDAFTPEVRATWTRLYTLFAQTMRMGSSGMTPDNVYGSEEDTSHSGEAALIQQQAAMGIDDAAMGIAEEES
jgi:hemoglobin-like flavoprotein